MPRAPSARASHAASYSQTISVLESDPSQPHPSIPPVPSVTSIATLSTIPGHPAPRVSASPPPTAGTAQIAAVRSTSGSRSRAPAATPLASRYTSPPATAGTGSATEPVGAPASHSTEIAACPTARSSQPINRTSRSAFRLIETQPPRKVHIQHASRAHPHPPSLPQASIQELALFAAPASHQAIDKPTSSHRQAHIKPQTSPHQATGPFPPELRTSTSSSKRERYRIIARRSSSALGSSPPGRRAIARADR